MMDASVCSPCYLLLTVLLSSPFFHFMTPQMVDDAQNAHLHDGGELVDFHVDSQTMVDEGDAFVMDSRVCIR